MNHQSLSSNELAVMRALWNAGTPLSRPEILDRLSNQNWNPNSIHLVLNNLLKKGYVKIEGMTRCGQSYGRTYYATKNQGEYAAGLALNAIAGDTQAEAVFEVMSAMVKSVEMSENTLDKLQKMLDAYKKASKED